MKLTGSNYIGSKASHTGTVQFTSSNPTTGENGSLLFTEATQQEISEAVEKASIAYPIFKNISAEKRATFLDEIANQILELGDELFEVCTPETALSRGRLKGERGRTMNQLKLFAQVVREGSWVDARIDLAEPNRAPFAKSDIRQMQIPLGPVGIFGASNFPLAFSVAGGDTASALAAGCPVVVKAHPLHPATSEMIGRAILLAAQKTGMPDGVFSLLQGQSVDVGIGIVRHEKITAIGFTGSFKGGKAIFDEANRRPVPIPVFAEMGSANPVFILPSILKKQNERIAKGLCKSLNMGVGQFCTNPGLIITEKSTDAEAFMSHFKTALEEVQPGVMLSSNIKTNYERGFESLKTNDKIDLAFSSKKTEGVNGVQAHVLSSDVNTFLQDQNLQEEVFGPSTVSIRAENKNDVIEFAKKLEGHLTATIHGEKEELLEYKELVEVLQSKVGRLIFNGYPTGVEVCDAMVHGGPFPSTTAAQTTSVGTGAIKRFARPFCFQDCPSELLPPALKNDNPDSIWRMVDSQWTKDSIKE